MFAIRLIEGSQIETIAYASAKRHVDLKGKLDQEV